MEFTLQPIGIIHTSFTDKATTPIQPSRSEAIGRIEVSPDYVVGLQDIEG
jgi:tRNA (Thr-GGU) A37 N-methylase